jgi:membrane protease YdiL (CAAX protease family)
VTVGLFPSVAAAFLVGGLFTAAASGMGLGLLLRRFAILRKWWVQGALVGGLGFGLGNVLGVVGGLLLGAPLRFDPSMLATPPWLVAGTLGTGCGTASALLAAFLARSLHPGRWPGIRWLLAGVPAAAGVMLAGVCWMLALGAVGFEPEAQSLAAALGSQAGWVRAVVLTFVLAVAPLTEELLFRGWLQPLLRQRFGPQRAMVAQAVLFGAVHTDRLWAIPPLVLIGFTCGWLRERSGSVLPGWLLHVLNNGVAASM